MELENATKQYLLSFFLGIATHILYYSHGEHHLNANVYTWLIIIVFLLTPSILSLLHLLITHPLPAFFFQFYFYSFLPTFLAWLFGLYTSLLAYRLLFHPLRRFPGPWQARISTLWFSYHVRRGDAHRRVQALHERYGDFVRTGSSDLVICHPDAVPKIHGADSKCTKSPWYDMDYPVVNLLQTRSKAIHAREKRRWSRAFGDSKLKGYEERIKPMREELLSTYAQSAETSLPDITAASMPKDLAVGPTASSLPPPAVATPSSSPAPSKGVNVTDYNSLFSFDVLGDLALNHSFHMLRRREAHWALAVVRGGFRVFTFHFPPWMLRTFMAFPYLGRDWQRFFTYTRALLNYRMSDEKMQEADQMEREGRGDLIGALLEKWKIGPPAATGDPEKAGTKGKGAKWSWMDVDEDALRWLQGDSRLVIGAGSDTTALSLTVILYFLVRNPEHIVRLREEVAPCFTAEGRLDDHLKLQGLEHLNGVVNESLRLIPTVPANLYRVTPEEGIWIGGTHVPGGMTVWCSQYALGRCMLPLCRSSLPCAHALLTRQTTFA